MCWKGVDQDFNMDELSLLKYLMILLGTSRALELCSDSANMAFNGS